MPSGPVQAASTALAHLLETLDLETLDADRFRGLTPAVGWRRVFGGQVIAQALVAAQRTMVETRFVHSLHCYFILPGNPDIPIDYAVERLREGRSFSTRRVVAWQEDRAIFTLSASFQTDERGLQHQAAMPEVPDPDDLASDKELVTTMGDALPPALRAYWARERAVELRPVSLTHFTSHEPLPPAQNIWMRVKGDMPDAPELRKAILAYFSDMTLLDTALYPHGKSIFDGDIMPASLDHAMWFHQAPRFDDWILYAQDSPWTGGSRGLTRGFLFARDGTLLASVTQEGLLRLRGDGSRA